MATISLEKQIESKKQELLRLVTQYGYTHPLVISHSQELDQLVHLFMIQF
ncbi:aspartyl-phosphate phosphatase Spo0E family protein [Bacillus cereus]